MKNTTNRVETRMCFVTIGLPDGTPFSIATTLDYVVVMPLRTGALKEPECGATKYRVVSPKRYAFARLTRLWPSKIVTTVHRVSTAVFLKHIAARIH